MTLWPADEMVMAFFQAAVASLGGLSFIYILTQKIRGREKFAFLFLSVSFLSLCKLVQIGEILPPDFYKRIISSAMVLFSSALYFLFQGEKDKDKDFFRNMTLISGGALLFLFAVPDRFIAFVFFPVYYLFFVLKAVRMFFCRSKKKLPGALYGEALFLLGLLLPLGYDPSAVFKDLLGINFPAAAGFAILFFVYLWAFSHNNISRKQFIKYFTSLFIVYFICVFFSFFYSSYYSYAIHKSHLQREIFLILTHVTFFTVVFLYLFYGTFSRWLVRFFIKSYEEKEEALRDLTLEINPMYKLNDIFLTFAENFERLTTFSLKASMIFDGESSAVVFKGDDKEKISGDLRILRNASKEQIVVPSEFFFRSTFLLLNSLKRLSVCQDFGYIIPVRIKGVFEGLFITEPLTLNQKLKTAKLLSFLEHFKATVEKVMLNAKQLSREKEIHDKILALQEKKRTSDEFKKKNTELQTALEQLQSKQKQLIMAEKWASICQVTVSLNHEINNPLTHIMGSSQILKMQIKRGSGMGREELYDYLSKVETQCQRIKDIIENLRKVSEPVTVSYLSNVQMLKLRKEEP